MPLYSTESVFVQTVVAFLLAGFGYGDGDDRTVLKEMKGNYTQVFIRREFEIPAGTDKRRIGLVINYDDGFALFLKTANKCWRNP